jgi:hypothetical protein
MAVVDVGDLNLTSYRGQTGLDANSTIVVVARTGDANVDGKVDAFDLNLLAAHWQSTGMLWSSGDFTGDGKVDAFDLNILAANWQFGVGGSVEAAFTAAAVPEAGTLGALGGLLAVLGVGRRRRR